MLASEDGLKAVIFTQSSTQSQQYTAEMIAMKMGISLDGFLKIEPILVKYKLLNKNTLVINDKDIKVYHKLDNSEIRPLLMIAYQFINSKQCYYNYLCSRTKPYLENK